MNASRRSVSHSNDVCVVRYEDQYEKDFARLNFEWIRTHFEVEEPDVRSLNDPFGSIIADGGEIFFVLVAGIVRGTCALINHGDGRFELAKMAVEPDSRGKGSRRYFSSQTLSSLLRSICTSSMGFRRRVRVRTPITNARTLR